MGTWGEGNFDSDGARDYLNEVVVSFIGRIETCLADEELSRLDEDGESILMPSVEILALLCEQFRARPPEESRVKEWKEKYLQIYDEEIDGLEPAPGYKEERRKAIEATFDRLIAQAQR